MIKEEPKNETEILSADEQKIREMCLSLKKIDAPKDFNFKLKARIANSKPSNFQPRFGFTFRYAVPALALIFVLGLLAYNGGFLSSKNNSTIAESSVEPQNPALSKNTATSNFLIPENKKQLKDDVAISSSNQTLPKVLENEIASSNPKKTKKDFPENKKDSFNGSRDFDSKRDIPRQPNFNSNSFPQKPQINETTNPISVKEVLLINGISADFENGKWTVKSVTVNSVGESSGVKESDVIEAIDSQTISAETVFNKTINGKTITVVRDSKKLEIKLRNKQ